MVFRRELSDTLCAHWRLLHAARAFLGHSGR